MPELSYGRLQQVGQRLEKTQITQGHTMETDELIENLLNQPIQEKTSPPSEVMIDRVQELMKRLEFELHSLQAARPLGGGDKPATWVCEEIFLEHMIKDLQAILKE